jgi:hypothetical protein
LPSAKEVPAGENCLYDSGRDYLTHLATYNHFTRTFSHLIVVVPTAAAGSALTSYAWPETNTQHVFFLGTNQHIYELWWEPTNGWHLNDLTGAASF